MGRYDRREIDLTVPNPAATVSGTLDLGVDYAQIIGISALTVGTDAATRVSVTDADSNVVFLDAADRDYDTARVNLLPNVDDTTTGLSFVPRDATGAAIGAGKAGGMPIAIVKNPLTVALINGGTAGDTANIKFYYERLPWSKRTFTITIPNPAATQEETINVPGKYVRVRGFSLKNAGADAATKLRIRDADNLVAYLDAADTDYATATVKTLICPDATTTGLSWVPVDATGAAQSADVSGILPILKAPIKVAVVNGGTAGEVFTCSVWTEQ